MARRFTDNINLRWGADCNLLQGWVHIEAPPKKIVVTDKPSRGYYFEWFAKGTDLILRCERSKKAPGCGESAAVYFMKNDDWITDGLAELIVCAE